VQNRRVSWFAQTWGCKKCGLVQLVKIVIHSNPGLANQIESSGWLKSGFERHGLDCEVTADRYKPADVHVVQGPHYAWDEWLGKENVIWLDRCFYGSSRFDLSIGWLNADGSRDFKNKGMAAGNGDLPELKTMKPHQESAVVFADYGKMDQARHWEVDARSKYFPVHLRFHPADMQSIYPLADMWQRCDVAIGGTSTILVEAAINGLHIKQCDPLHVCHEMGDRAQWLTDLSWAQWNHTEIINGNFWEHLQ
jgi:hypothetical protein